MASVEERFQAAVNVIKGLPKNGPYQPSSTMMLQFYGLFKQATNGPCHQKRPSFWDIVGRAKWDAWNSNRHLTKQQAMEKYVDGLREIIETMSFTENVQNFVGSLSGLENINLDELDMVAPGMRQLAESHPNSPFNSRTNSPHHGSSTNLNGNAQEAMNDHREHNGFNDENTIMNGPDLSSQLVSSPEANGLGSTPLLNSMSSSAVDQSDDEYGDPVDIQNELTEAILTNSETLRHIRTTISLMNAEVMAVSQRMTSLEKSIKDVHNSVRGSQACKTIGISAGHSYPKWWPFKDISPLWFVVLILWPFLARRMGNMITPSRRK